MLRFNIPDILSAFFPREERIVFTVFRDPLCNFEIYHPKGWKYDKNIAVVDGKYTVSFASRDNQFTIAVDASLPAGFDFNKYAKAELESPESGIHASIKKQRFRGMPAYRREYSYSSGGKDYFGGGLMFFTGKAVFSLSWSAPEADREKMEAVFGHMLDKLKLYEGFSIRKKK